MTTFGGALPLLGRTCGAPVLCNQGAVEAVGRPDEILGSRRVVEAYVGEDEEFCVAHRAYVLDAGRVLVAGAGPELLDDPEARRALLDVGREASA